MPIFTFTGHTLPELLEKPTNGDRYIKANEIKFFYIKQYVSPKSCVDFNSPLKSTWILQHQHLRQVKMYFSLLFLIVRNVCLVSVFLWQ